MALADTIAAVWSADWDALSDASVMPLLPQTTVRDIPLSDLVPWLNDEALASRMRRTVASPVFAGVVAAASAAAVAAGGPALVLVIVQDEVLDALDYLASPHNAYLATTDADRAAKTTRLLALMVACNGQDATLGLTADQAATFLSWGGGLQFAGAVAGDVTSARAAVTAARAAAAVDAAVKPLADAVDTALGWIDSSAANLSALLGTQVGPTQRGRLIQYVQTYRTLLQANDPAAATYDATLAGAWAFAKQGGA